MRRASGVVDAVDCGSIGPKNSLDAVNTANADKGGIEAVFQRLGLESRESITDGPLSRHRQPDRCTLLACSTESGLSVAPALDDAVRRPSDHSSRKVASKPPDDEENRMSPTKRYLLERETLEGTEEQLQKAKRKTFESANKEGKKAKVVHAHS